MSKLLTVADLLIEWYHINARPLPWRDTNDPYKIWVSEIILQQTTVQQGNAYYTSFISRFPNIHALADAEEKTVLKSWEGLGYYSRARNLHHSAKHIVSHLGGKIPDTYDALLKLKGVGPYTAAAIASFAFKLPHVVIDGNVLRLFSRLFGIAEDVGLQSTKNKIWALGQEMIASQDPYYFNQSIMEFGALVCTPHNPACAKCVLSSSCVAFKTNQVNALPVKSKKKKKKKRFFHYSVVLSEDGYLLINQRSDKDIWKGLFEFPLQEVDEIHFDNYSLKTSFRDIVSSAPEVSRVYKQELTHQTIYSRFYKHIIKKGVFLRKLKKFQTVSRSELKQFAFPKTTCLYLVDNSITLDNIPYNNHR